MLRVSLLTWCSTSELGNYGLYSDICRVVLRHESSVGLKRDVEAWWNHRLWTLKKIFKNSALEMCKKRTLKERSLFCCCCCCCLWAHPNWSRQMAAPPWAKVLVQRGSYDCWVFLSMYYLGSTLQYKVYSSLYSKCCHWFSVNGHWIGSYSAFLLEHSKHFIQHGSLTQPPQSYSWFCFIYNHLCQFLIFIM